MENTINTVLLTVIVPLQYTEISRAACKNNTKETTKNFKKKWQQILKKKSKRKHFLHWARIQDHPCSVFFWLIQVFDRQLEAAVELLLPQQTAFTQLQK